MEWKDGYPKPNGASDWEDSSHLAGILVLIDHPQAPDMMKYYDGSKYIRCIGSKYDCSRDQGVMIMSACLKQGFKGLVNIKYINGKDILLPSVHGIQSIAETGKYSWLQSKTLELEIDFKCRNEGSMIGEPFQDMVKCMAYDLATGGNYWLKMWTTKNYLWDLAILKYLRAGDDRWRNEPELAEYVIKYVLEKVK
jgi:hypothetical protein